MELDADKLEKLVSVVAATVQTDGPQPAAYLVELMAGYDPREQESRLHKLTQIIDLDDRLPTESEWTELKRIVLESGLYKKTRVDLATSSQAAKDLMEYLHPKLSRTSVEQSGGLRQEVSPLTPKEVEVFEDWFFGEF